MTGGLMSSMHPHSFIHESNRCDPYPLVNVYIANWKITMLLMGKLTISMAIFNSYVSLLEGVPHWC